MQLSHQFTVPASIEAAWAAFNDLEGVVPCFPGAALTSYDGETFAGLVKVKLGPISLQYSGTGKFVERDEAAYRAVVEAKGKDKRGNGTASATVTAELTATSDTETAVSVQTDLNVTGRPAQFGRGVMQDVSDKLLSQFAACLETEMSGQDGSNKAGVQPATPVEPATPVQPAQTVELVTPAESVELVTPAETAETVSANARHPAAAEPSVVVDPSPVTPSTAPRRVESTPPAELDLGLTLLPIIMKRYGHALVGVALVLWVAWKMKRRA